MVLSKALEIGNTAVGIVILQPCEHTSEEKRASLGLAVNSNFLSFIEYYSPIQNIHYPSSELFL